MPEKKQKEPVEPDKKTSAPRQTEESLRLATLLKQENIPDLEANGFLAGSGLKPTDRMTRSAFGKRFNAWRTSPAGKDKP